jgi:hypothetical protein
MDPASFRSLLTRHMIRRAVSRIRLLRGRAVESSDPAPTPGGIRFRRRGPSWPERSPTIPRQTAGATRDTAAGEACGGRDSCSASPSVRLSTPKRSHPACRRVPHFSRFCEKWGFPRQACQSPTLRQAQGRLSRQRREKWGARLSPVRLFPGRVGLRTTDSRSRRAPAAASRSRTVPDRSGKLHRIADNSWVTIRTTIWINVRLSLNLVKPIVGPVSRKITQPQYSVNTPAAPSSVQPGAGRPESYPFQLLSRWHRRAKFTIPPIQRHEYCALPMIRFR